MENDNIRENENINEETIEESVMDIEETTEVVEEIAEEVLETDAEPMVAVVDEAEALAAIGKPKSKKPLIIAGAVVLGAIAAFLIYCVLVVFGVGSNSVVSNPITDENGEVAIENIKYEFPLVSLFSKDVAMTVNGVPVSRNILQYATNALALNDVKTLSQDGEEFDYANFDWDAIRKGTKLSYIEYVKGLAIEDLAEIYAIISEGNKNGISVTAEEEKEILDWVEGLKEEYGDQFDAALKASGYDSVEMLVEFNKMNANVQKVYEDASADLKKYVTDESKLEMDESFITVKHILIQFEDETDKAKVEEAKKKADEVYAEVMAGADFDDMVEKYNEDPGATEEGYTFANDGTMVQEFADASFALEVGQVSEPVQTPYGYHIIKRVERKPVIQDYIKSLRKNAKVRLNNFVYDNVKATINLNDFLGK